MSCIFMGRKELTTENNHICKTFWTDAAVPENLNTKKSVFFSLTSKALRINF